MADFSLRSAKASDAALIAEQRPLYERLGFQVALNPDMRLMLEPLTCPD